jgi:drug/metabolite transporter (DMT)-like permease
MRTSTIILLLFYSILSAIALIFFRHSMPKVLDAQPSERWSVIWSSHLASGLFLYFVSMLCWLLLIAKIEVSILYPVAFALVAIETLVLARIFLREELNWVHGIGIGAIFIGVWLVQRASQS